MTHNRPWINVSYSSQGYDSWEDDADLITHFKSNKEIFVQRKEAEKTEQNQLAGSQDL